MKITKEQDFLNKLEAADMALYQLWRLCPAEGELIQALNRFQKEFVQEEIKKLKY